MINPSSGQKKKTDYEAVVREYFRDKPLYEPVFRFLQGNSTDDALLRQIVSQQPTAVVAVGGDGTVRLIATHLLHTGIPPGHTARRLGQRHGP